MIKTLINSAYLLKKYMKGEILSREEITEEYSKLVNSYTKWNQAMMPHPESSMEFFRLLELPRPLKILDFACGMGAVTRALETFLKSHNISEYHITAIDGAEQFIDYARNNLSSDKINFIHQEGMDFLTKQANQSYSAIFCGWALPYFPLKSIFNQWARLLPPQGLLSLVSNQKGTLKHIEGIFLKVMISHPDEVYKIMNTARNLPKNPEQLNRLAGSTGLLPIMSKSHSRSFGFTTAEDLLNWLLTSGALAGVQKIFYNFEKVRPEITEFMAKQCYNIKQEEFVINHDFISAVYQKKS